MIPTKGNEMLWDKYALVQPRKPQIPHELPWDWTRSSSMKGQPLPCHGLHLLTFIYDNVLKTGCHGIMTQPGASYRVTKVEPLSLSLSLSLYIYIYIYIYIYSLWYEEERTNFLNVFMQTNIVPTYCNAPSSESSKPEYSFKWGIPFVFYQHMCVKL